MSVCRRVRTTLVIAVGVCAGSCSGSQLLTSTTDLTRLQQEKVALNQKLPTLKGSTRDAAVVQISHIDGEFERIADAAYASARQVSDIKAKISNYRIAATADWQRGDNRALTVAREGTDACNASNGFDVAPRDCTILLVIPDLMVNDLWSLKFQEALRESRTSVGGLASKYRPAIFDLLASYKGLEQAEARISGTSVSRQMIDVIRSRRETIGINIGKFVELFVTRSTPADRPDIVGICADIQATAAAIVPSRCRTFR